MRSFVLLTILACFMALAWSAAVEQQQLEDADAQVVYDAPEGAETVRQTRQFGFGFGNPYGGYYGRPYYGGGGGFYGRPYGGYYGRPYGGFYGRPYGGFGGFYG